MGIRRLWSYFAERNLNNFLIKKPTTMAAAKKAMVIKIVIQGLAVGSLNPITMERTTMPMTSSIMAADRMVVPTLPLSFPISLSVSTVIPTLVAARMTPTNTASKRIAESDSAEKPPRKGTAIRNPSPIGTMTPPHAMSVAVSPERFSSPTSVSRPAEKSMRTTPISAIPSRNCPSASVGLMGDHHPN